MKTQMIMAEQAKIPMSLIKAAVPIRVSTQHLFAGYRSCSSKPTIMPIEKTTKISSGMKP